MADTVITILAAKAMGADSTETEAEDMMVIKAVTGVRVGVNGTYSTLPIPKTVSGSSGATRPTVMEVGRDDKRV